MVFAGALGIASYDLPLSYSNPPPDTPPIRVTQPVHQVEPIKAPTSAAAWQCDEVVGRVRAYADVDAGIIPSPFAAVYDRDLSHDLTGGHFIVTSCDPDFGCSLYVMGLHGEDQHVFSSGALTSAGRGITIGARGAVGRDWIWAVDMDNRITKIDWDGQCDNFGLPFEVKCALGIAYDTRSSSILLYDYGDYPEYINRIHQLDPASLVIRNTVDSPVNDGMGIACDGCSGTMYISRLGTEHFLEVTPVYQGNVLTALANPQTRAWHDEGFPVIDDAGGLSYNAATRQLVLTNMGWDGDPGIFTSIDDGCCVYTDINMDGYVNFADVHVVMDCMNGEGTTTPPPGMEPTFFRNADADGDGDVDMGDLQAFQVEYAPS